MGTFVLKMGTFVLKMGTFCFKNGYFWEKLLKNGLTHRSYTNEK
jgi:hypothetical protein